MTERRGSDRTTREIEEKSEGGGGRKSRKTKVGEKP